VSDGIELLYQLNNSLEETVKKLALTLFAIMLAAVVAAPIATAQEPASKEEVQAKLQGMATALQLTDDQKAKIKPILMAEAPKIQALKADTSMPQMQKMQQMKKLADGVDAKIKPILTPEQYQKFQEMRMQQRDQMMQKMQ
jgi:Spy/CpxP family protein refolding chaperone